MGQFVWKPTIVLKILLLELTISIILITILLALLPSIFYSAAATQASETIHSVSSQPLDTINNHFDTLKRYSNVINTNGGFHNLLLRRDEPPVASSLRKELGKMYFFDGELIETGMIVFHDNTVLATDMITRTDLAQIDSDWFTQYRTSGFQEAYHLVQGTGDASPVLYYVRKFNNFENGNASIVFRCTFEPFEEAFNIILNNVSHLTILDAGLSPIYPGKANLVWIKTVQAAIAAGASDRGVFAETQDGITITYPLKYSGWHVVLEMTREKLLSPYLNAIKLVMLAIILFFVILQLAIVIMLSYILRPVHHLSQSMQQLADGDLDVRADIHTGDEIEMLAKSFNRMAEKMSTNTRQLVEKEKLEQQMKYSLLISQIDPHFIYNTMNTITYLARHGRSTDVIKVNRNLMDMLKDRLRVSADEFCDSLDREIEILKSYMVIQRYRYGDYFEVKWDIPDELRPVQVPKNIIQPIMENALYHGLLANKDEDGNLIGGLITVSVRRDGDFIQISVSDNGKGMENWKADAFNQGQDTFAHLRGEHIGLKNIRERMQYLYRQDYSMTIASSPDEGTTVTVRYRTKTG